MSTYVTEIPFKTIGLKPSDIEVVMGFSPGMAPEPYKELIIKLIDEAVQLCSIIGGYTIHSASPVLGSDDKWHVSDTILEMGQVISSQIRNSSSMAVFVCTAGNGISHKARSAMDNGDLISGYIYDTIGSVTVDMAMNIIHDQLKQAMQSEGMMVTNRFSPGYCGWDVAGQQVLFRLLDNGFCGVQLSSDSLMVPVKSVSGVIGIGREVQFSKYMCHLCIMENCVYSKRSLIQ